jgi:hypothetical protein
LLCAGRTRVRPAVEECHQPVVDAVRYLAGGGGMVQRGREQAGEVIGGDGFVQLGSVAGDVSLKKLEEYVNADDSGKDFVFA